MPAHNIAGLPVCAREAVRISTPRILVEVYGAVRHNANYNLRAYLVRNIKKPVWVIERNKIAHLRGAQDYIREVVRYVSEPFVLRFGNFPVTLGE